MSVIWGLGHLWNEDRKGGTGLWPPSGALGSQWLGSQVRLRPQNWNYA